MPILKRICLSIIVSMVLTAFSFTTQAHALHGVCVHLPYWQMSVEPEREEEAIFPMTYYAVGSASAINVFLSVESEILPDVLKPGITAPHYIGYFIINHDLSMQFVPKTNHPIIGSYFIDGVGMYVDVYKKDFLKDPNFSYEKLRTFLVSQFGGLVCRGVFIIQGKPGEEPDDSFIPDFKENTVVHSLEEARQAAKTRGFEAYHYIFDIFEPTNLKPGMRVLMPQPTGYQGFIHTQPWMPKSDETTK